MSCQRSHGRINFNAQFAGELHERWAHFSPGNVTIAMGDQGLDLAPMKAGAEGLAERALEAVRGLS